MVYAKKAQVGSFLPNNVTSVETFSLCSVQCHYVMMCKDSRGIILFIYDLDIPAAVAQGQRLDFQLKKGQGGSRNCSGGCGEEKSLWSHANNLRAVSRLFNPYISHTDLARLLCKQFTLLILHPFSYLCMSI
jgi:hypothetical protein